MGQPLSQPMDVDASAATRGVEYFLQMSQYSVASLIREGMDIDLVMNPYQMTRLSTDDPDQPKAEIKPTVHLDNPLHLVAKSVELSSTYSQNIPIHRINFSLYTCVPFYLTIHLMVVEEADYRGRPSFSPLHPDLKPIRFSLNPGFNVPFSQVLPQAFVEALCYLQLSADHPTLDSTLSPFYPPASITTLQQIKTAATKQGFHAIVVELEPALPLPTGEGGVGGISGGYCEVEWTQVTATTTATLTSLSPRPSPPSPVPATDSPLYLSLTTMATQTTQQLVASPDALFELLEVYGFSNQSNADNAPGSVAIDVQSPTDCVICMGCPSQAVILPCRHMCLCASCAQSLIDQTDQTKCPMCRERVASIVKLH